jgi:hypothetical protein
LISKYMYGWSEKDGKLAYHVPNGTRQVDGGAPANIEGQDDSDSDM